MPKISKFFVQFNADRNKKISFQNVEDTMTVKELKEQIIQVHGNGLGKVGTLVYLSQSMKDDKTLAYYKVKKLRTIFATFKLQGGTSLELEEFKKLDFKELSELNVRLSTNKCQLNGAYATCASSCTQRMRMPICSKKYSQSCWYCYKCMRDIVTRAVGQLQNKIECPHKCGEFKFDTILHCGYFDEEQEEEVIYQYHKNELDRKGVRPCPGCQNYVVKPKEVKGNRVRCPNTRCQWNSKDYCFLCSLVWQNNSSNEKCGREECEDGFALFAESQIKNCGTRPYKYTEEVGTIEDIPIMRLCPNPLCHELLEWEDQCKHLTCYRCDHGYCQSCLKAWNSCRCKYCRENKLEKCFLRIKCTPAPRQDALELLGV